METHAGPHRAAALLIMNLCIKATKGKHPGSEQFYRPCMNITSGNDDQHGC